MAAALRQYDDPSNIKTIAKIAYEEDVPVSTLHHRIRHTRRTAIDEANRRQKLTPQEETMICDMVLRKSRLYYPMPPSSIHWLAEQVLKRLRSDPTAFLGQNWTAAFKKRHPEMLRRWNEIGAPGGSRPLSHLTLCEYFDRLQTVLDEQSIPLINIYNMDETGFKLNEQSRQVVYTDRVANPRGQTRQLPQQNNITAIEICRNCSRDPLPMPGFLILKGNRHFLHGALFKSGVEYENLRIMRTEKGFQSSRTMLDWLGEFIKCTAHVEGRKLLLLDGYSGHRSAALAQLAEENGIVLFSMPPNATSLLQPLDVGVFFHLKKEYKRILKEAQLTSNLCKFPVADFIAEYSGMRRRSMTSQTVLNGFRRCGITPTALRPSSVLQKLPDAPRTPSPPVETPLEPQIFTPQHGGALSAMCHSLHGSTPRTVRRKLIKVDKCISNMSCANAEHEIEKEGRELAAQQAEESQTLRPVRWGVHSSQDAGEVRDILEPRSRRLDARVAVRATATHQRREQVNPLADEAMTSGSESDESSELTDAPPLPILSTRPRRRAAAGATAATQAEKRNTSRIGRQTMDLSDFTSMSN